jgi:hypothetical protein
MPLQVVFTCEAFTTSTSTITNFIRRSAECIRYEK